MSVLPALKRFGQHNQPAKIRARAHKSVHVDAGCQGVWSNATFRSNKLYTREVLMRFIACVVTCLLPMSANAAETTSQTSPDPQSYCVDSSADFYPYTGELCKSGYQLGAGNCRRTDGRLVAVARQECLAQAGTIELPGPPMVPRPPHAPLPQTRPLQAPK